MYCAYKLTDPKSNSCYRPSNLFPHFPLILVKSNSIFPIVQAKDLSSLFFSFPHAAAAAAKSLNSCPTLCDPIDRSLLGSPVPGILQARTLEWVATSFSNAWKWKVKVKLLSHVRLFVTPWTAAYQAPPPMEFSRQEYWSGVPLPSLPFPMSHILFIYKSCQQYFQNISGMQTFLTTSTATVLAQIITVFFWITTMLVQTITVFLDYYNSLSLLPSQIT